MLKATACGVEGGRETMFWRRSHVQEGMERGETLDSLGDYPVPKECLRVVRKLRQDMACWCYCLA